MAKVIILRGRQAERDMTANLNSNFTEVYDKNASQDTGILDAQDDVVIVGLETVTANTTLVVPAGYRLDSLDVVNTTANAVTGGVRVGTTNGGAEVVAALAVGANALTSATDAEILKRVFSTTASQTLYLQAVTAWNGASLRVRVQLVQVF